MEESHVQECSAKSVETTTSNEFNLLLDEITARCNRQTKEIHKWLVYTEDLKQAITDTLEKEKLRKQGADIKAMKRSPQFPKHPELREHPEYSKYPISISSFHCLSFVEFPQVSKVRKQRING
ncbi:hypothetical protein N7453_009840 [Penicillium expansum]|nr:hypothetical protein N7453_009840 [Penicillium expansum]